MPTRKGTRKSRKSSRKYVVKGSGSYRRRPITSRIKRVVGSGSYHTKRDYGNSRDFIQPTYGSYKSDLSSGIKSIGSGLGGMFSSLLGLGDYKVKANTLTGVGPGMNDQIPAMHDINGGVRICHREYLGDIYGSINFNNVSFAIQPANSTTFPWLSQLALNFEQWKPLGLIFEFRSMSSDTQIASSTALGSVVLATEYNALAPGFASKQAMENSQFVVSTKPSASVIHPIECDLSQTPNQPLYIRLPQSSTGDARLFDLGNFQIATQGMLTDGSNQGELWVSYDVILLKPIIGNTLGVDIPFTHTYNKFNVGDCNDVAIFGVAPLESQNSVLNMTINNTTNVVAFTPSVTYEASLLYIEFSWIYHTPQLAPLPVPNFILTNCTQANILWGSRQSFINTALSSCRVSFYLIPTDVGLPFEVAFLSALIGLVGDADVDVYATQVNSNVLNVTSSFEAVSASSVAAIIDRDDAFLDRLARRMLQINDKKEEEKECDTETDEVSLLKAEVEQYRALQASARKITANILKS